MTQCVKSDGVFYLPKYKCIMSLVTRLAVVDKCHSWGMLSTKAKSFHLSWWRKGKCQGSLISWEQRIRAEFSGRLDRVRPVVQHLTYIKLKSHGNEGEMTAFIKCINTIWGYLPASHLSHAQWCTSRSCDEWTGHPQMLHVCTLLWNPHLHIDENEQDTAAGAADPCVSIPREKDGPK